MLFEWAQTLIAGYYQRANNWSRGTLEIWVHAFRQFNRAQGLEAAAAVAFYAIFSLVPLVLTLISLAGFLLKGEQAIDLVLKFIFEITPVSPNWLEKILREIITQRSISGIVGLVGLLLSASGVFLTLARNINRAWPNAKGRNLLHGHLIAFGLIGALGTLLVLWLVWSGVINLLSAFEFSFMNHSFPLTEYVWHPLSKFFYTLASFLLFLLLYHWLPNTHVRWSEAFWGALTASITWTLVTQVFTWFLSSGMATYNVLYGPLGTSIALLTWILASAVITLFGAHLSASIAHAKRPDLLGIPTQPTPKSN
jgi:membrane protein